MFYCIWIEQMVCISLSSWLFSCVNELSVLKAAWLIPWGCWSCWH